MMTIFFILLTIWLCREEDEPGWPDASLILSPLMLTTERSARGKGPR